jgi:hypothetical protein
MINGSCAADAIGRVFCPSHDRDQGTPLSWGRTEPMNFGFIIAQISIAVSGTTLAILIHPSIPAAIALIAYLWMLVVIQIRKQKEHKIPIIA